MLRWQRNNITSIQLGTKASRGDWAQQHHVLYCWQTNFTHIQIWLIIIFCHLNSIKRLIYIQSFIYINNLKKYDIEYENYTVGNSINQKRTLKPTIFA